MAVPARAHGRTSRCPCPAGGDRERRAMSGLSPAGAARMIAVAALQEQGERLVVRGERIAAEDGGWHKVKPGPVNVCFCRGFGGAHEPHFVYMLGVERIEREQAVWFPHDAREEGSR